MKMNSLDTQPYQGTDLDGGTPVARRFAISMGASEATFGPGSTINITIEVSAILPTAGADIRFAAPELQSASSSGWGRQFRVPEGVAIPSLQSWTANLERGGKATFTAAVQADAPGYYRLVVTARDPGSSHTVADGTIVENFAVKEVWLHIAEGSGGIHEQADLRVFPKGTRRIPGPFRTVETRTGSSQQYTVQSASYTGNFRLMYYNADAQAYQPVPYALIEMREHDYYSGYVGTTFTGVDSNGYFTTGCPASGTYYDTSVILKSSSVEMVPAGGIADFSIWDNDCEWSEDVVQITTVPFAVWLDAVSGRFIDGYSPIRHFSI